MKSFQVTAVAAIPMSGVQAVTVTGVAR